jgi:hypothetical protein
MMPTTRIAMGMVFQIPVITARRLLTRFKPTAMETTEAMSAALMSMRILMGMVLETPLITVR